MASQDGCPRGEVCARVAGPSAGPAECCPVASRVRGQLRVRLGLHGDTCGEGKRPHAGRAGAWREPAAEGPRVFSSCVTLGQSEGIVIAPCPRGF